WAMLITPIWPKVRVSPSAASSRSAPSAVPFNSGGMSASTCCRSLYGEEFWRRFWSVGSRTRGGTGPHARWRSAGGGYKSIADVGGEPVVPFEVRVRIDEAVGRPDPSQLVFAVHPAGV